MPITTEQMDEKTMHKHKYTISLCPQCGNPRNAAVIRGLPVTRLCATCANRNRRTSRNLLPNDKTFLEDLYWNQRLSMNRIGHIYRVGPSIVAAHLTELGIRTRNRYEGHELMGESERGFNNPNWKNGRTQNGPDGYVFIYKPGHPRAHQNYVSEHILVWEEARGMPLPPRWEVHHFNGVKNDNRPENLVGLETRKHKRLIPAFQKRIRLLERQIALLKEGKDGSIKV